MQRLEYRNAKEPLVSVVVPFYNVRECVAYCIDSLLSQTFDDYEVICIDDGSSDGTGEILDKYAVCNSLIKVFHFENGGLSEARNRGVAVASGSYVTFVDGDDFVAPQYLEALVRAKGTSSNCLVKGRLLPGLYRDLIRHDWSCENLGAHTRCNCKTALQKILTGEVEESAAACLAPKEVYQRFPFKVGAKYEDLRSIGDIVMHVDEVILIDDPLYAYVSRTGSLVNASIMPSSQVKDYFDALQCLENVVKEYAVELIPIFEWKRAISLCRCFQSSRKMASREGRLILKKEISLSVRQNLKTLFSLRQEFDLSYTQLIRFVVIGYMPSLYAIMYRLRIIRKSSSV